MIQARDFSGLIGRTTGISDRAMREHLRLYQGYVDALNAIEAHYPGVDWGRPIGAQTPAPPGVERILRTPVRDLGIEIQGPLAAELKQVRRELLALGITWFPEIRLGPGAPYVPVGGTAIYMPWFLGNEALWWLVNERRDQYTTGEVAQLIRHEMGHAVTHAWDLHRHPDWVRLFGDPAQPYASTYVADPDSRDHVQYLHRAGLHHYAQKHPDEDFAETFATVLDPSTDWRRAYADKPAALAKLEWLSGLAASGALSKAPPHPEPGAGEDYRTLAHTVGDALGQRPPSSAWSPHSELLRREPYAYDAMVLHELYFEQLGGPGGQPPPALAEAAAVAFGSVDSWLLDLRAAAGSTNGWALAAWDPRRERLANFMVEDQRTGVPANCQIVLAIDCWEHAYMLDYGLDRHLYLGAVFAGMDWARVVSRMPVGL